MMFRFYLNHKREEKSNDDIGQKPQFSLPHLEFDRKLPTIQHWPNQTLDEENNRLCQEPLQQPL
jgi:hypothetical protein